MLFTGVALNQAEIKEKTLEEHLRRDAVGIEELTDLRIEADRQALQRRFAGRPGHGTRPGPGGEDWYIDASNTDGAVFVVVPSGVHHIRRRHRVVITRRLTPH